jgi:hypothetical protein
VKSGRLALLILVLIVVIVAVYFLLRPRQASETLNIDFAKYDGSLGSWTVTMRPPAPGESATEYRHDRVLYAAVQEIAGPPSDVQAIRFPEGTHALGVDVSGSAATVDLSSDVERSAGSALQENGEFKALTFTLTDISGITSVQVLVEGKRLATLPGGNLEIDTPLTRSDFQ